MQCRCDKNAHSSSNNKNIVSETNSTWALPRACLRLGSNVITVVLVSNSGAPKIAQLINSLKDNMGLEETGDGKLVDLVSGHYSTLLP